MEKQIKPKMYKGMESPTVELEREDLAEVKGGAITVSLDVLENDVHNQSYGMRRPSTGCISNPGGPSC